MHVRGCLLRSGKPAREDGRNHTAGAATTGDAAFRFRPGGVRERADRGNAVLWRASRRVTGVYVIEQGTDHAPDAAMFWSPATPHVMNGKTWRIAADSSAPPARRSRCVSMQAKIMSAVASGS